MEIGEIIPVSAILVGIFLTIIIFIWQINSQSSRLEARIEAHVNRLEAKIEAQGNRLDAKIEAQGSKLSEIEREQARLEGINSILGDIFRQQSHTHQAGD